MSKLTTIMFLSYLCTAASLFGRKQSVELFGEQLANFIFVGSLFIAFGIGMFKALRMIAGDFRLVKHSLTASKQKNSSKGNLSPAKSLEETPSKNDISITSAPVLTKTSEKQIKVISQKEDIRPNLVKSEDEVLASFPDASIIIEYDENASKLWKELKDLDKQIGFEFIENLQKDPKQDVKKLHEDLKRKFERKKLQRENPYADPKANKAFQEALQISEEAQDEFAKVYALMRDKLEPKQILEKVKTKHQNNNWRWK